MAKVKVIFDGFDTPQQAAMFKEWFSSYGEQHCSLYLREYTNLKSIETTHSYGDAEKGEMTQQIKLTYK